MTIRTQRTALAAALIGKINAATPAAMTENQLLGQAALHLMLDKVLMTDPMMADASVLLSATTAAELEDWMADEDARDAYRALLADYDKRYLAFSNATARAAIAGSGAAVWHMEYSAAAFDTALAHTDMRAAMFGSASARSSMLQNPSLRGWLLGTPTAANYTYALDNASMRAAMFADATTRGVILASSALMDIIWGNAVYRAAAFADANFRPAVAASAPAMTRLLATATARQAAWADANMQAAIAGSATALGLIDDTQAHMDEVLSSTYSAMRAAMIATAASRAAIAASATWMRRCVAVASFMAAGLADAGFATAWRASTALTAREIPTETATDANLTASSVTNSTFAEWKAADSDATGTEWLAASSAPGWIKYDFGSGKAINLHQMVLRAAATARPNAWTLEGSNDNSAWTTVATGTMANVTTDQTTTVGHDGGWRYYRFTVSSTHASSLPGLSDFDLKGFEVQ